MRDTDAAVLPSAPGRSDMAAPIILTPRIALAPCAASDRDDIIALHRDPRVIEYLLDGLPADTGTAAIYLAWAAALHARGIGPWVARRRRDAAFLGLFTLTPYVENEDTLLELGGRLARAAWLGDLAIEAGAALIDYAFDTLGRSALVSLHHPDNPTVPSVLGRLGFTDPELTTLYGQPAVIRHLSVTRWRVQGSRAAPRRRREHFSS